MNRIEVQSRTPDVFPLTVQSITGSGNKAMDVRMQRKVADLHPLVMEVFFRFSRITQDKPRTL
ncbi:MAG: hypothetical protein ABFD10_13540 [Prolixibacteraceae bacterium]